MLRVKLSAQRKLSAQEQHALDLIDPKVGGGVLFTLNIAEDKTYLCSDSDTLAFKPWWIDFTHPKLLQRIKQCGRRNEAVAKAVLSAEPEPLVFDATAGLGRDAIILQSAGAHVYMFERNPVIYLLLYDALIRAEEAVVKSVFRHGLPQLMPVGTLLEQAHSLPKPYAIYYDPMFPPRIKSALVKKDMQIFHHIAGTDQDTTDYLQALFNLGARRVVLKRPQYAGQLSIQRNPQFCIDGKACRYDCYII